MSCGIFFLERSTKYIVGEISVILEILPDSFYSKGIIKIVVDPNSYHLTILCGAAVFSIKFNLDEILPATPFDIFFLTVRVNALIICNTIQMSTVVGSVE